MHANHAPKKAARDRAQTTGLSYAAALAQLRAERLAHRDQVESGDLPAARRLRADDPVPVELPLLARHSVDAICSLFREVLSHGYFARNYGDWARIALYRLTDVLEELHLLIGTVAAHLQDNHFSPDRIRTFLQVDDQRQVQAFITDSAQRQLAGLLGKEPSEDDRSLNLFFNVGRSIVERGGWVESEREDVLEAFLTATYADSFRYLPDHVQAIAAQVAELIPTGRAGDEPAGAEPPTTAPET